MFENVDGRRTDAGVTGILIAHLGAFGSGELKKQQQKGRHVHTEWFKSTFLKFKVTWTRIFTE